MPSHGGEGREGGRKEENKEERRGKRRGWERRGKRRRQEKKEEEGKKERTAEEKEEERRGPLPILKWREKDMVIWTDVCKSLMQLITEDAPNYLCSDFVMIDHPLL